MLRFFSCAIAILVLVTAQPCRAADPAASLTYLTEEFKPYNYQERGQAKGLAIDLLKLIWNEMDTPEQPIHFMPWPRAYEMALSEPSVVLFSMLKTESRTDRFKWVCPVSLSKTYFWSMANRTISMNTIEDGKGLTVGVIKDYASAHLIKKYASTLNVDTLASMEMAIRKLEVGRIDLLSFEERAFKRIIKKMTNLFVIFERSIFSMKPNPVLLLTSPHRTN